jgi:excisionase family DNA binding protein
MSIHSIGFPEDEPLLVRPKVACRLLSVGETRLYEMMNSGELESFRDGGARRITTRSIHAYIERLIELERARAAERTKAA